MRSSNKDRWAEEVIGDFVDYVEMYGGNPDKVMAMINKNLDKLLKALIIIIRPEYRVKVVEWIERITKAIS